MNARSMPSVPVVPPMPVRDPSLLQGLWALARRDLQLLLRRRSDTLGVLVFFVLVVSLFPLAIGPDAALLQRLGAGVVWVAALLASMLSMARLFAEDHRDGCLEQMLLSPHPLPLLVLAKASAHWAGSGALLVLVSPLLALQMGLPLDAAWVLGVSLLLGTPLLSLVGAVGAALTVGLRQGGVLVSLLTLPLLVPVLVFGAGAVEAHQAGLGAGAHLSLLGALLLLAIPVAPWAAAAALRIALD